LLKNNIKMKKILSLILISGLICSCGGGGGGEDNPIPENKAPSIPALLSPANGIVCIDSNIVFNWELSKDPENDTIDYDFQIASDASFSVVLDVFNLSNTTKEVSLEKGKVYYWRVKALDSKGNKSAFSTVYNFYTEAEAEINQPPFSPVLSAPVMGAVITENSFSPSDMLNVVLEWNTEDPDNDSMLFEVFLGTTNPPAENVVSGTSELKLEQSLKVASTYYWYVTATDQIGDKTIGQVWSFKTD